MLQLQCPCVFHFMQVQSTYCLYLQTGLEFYLNFHALIKGSTETFFNPTLKVCNICMHKPRLLEYILFTNFLTWYQLETYIVDSLWWIDSIDVFVKVIIRIFLKYFLVYNSSHKLWMSRFDLINFVKELYNLKTRTRFQKKKVD